MALDHNAVVTELWRRINEALKIPLQTAATAASDALLAQIAAEAARDEARGVRQYVDTELEKKADTSHTHVSADVSDAVDHIHGGRAGRLVVVGEHGHIRDGNPPTDQYDLANKQYVDREVGKKADTSHTHRSADVTDTVNYFGSEVSANRVVTTGNDGQLHSSRHPASGNHLARKGYVDQEVGKKAPLEHRHTSEQIDGLDDTLNTAMTTKADITYVDEQDSIQFLKDRSGNTQIWDLPASAVSQTSNDIVVRGSDGVIHQTILPDDDSHVANKQYVDAMSAAEIIARNLALAQKADTGHMHVTADITDTTNWVNNATHPNKIVKTRNDGYVHGNDPTARPHVATKSYVDDNDPWIGTQAAYNGVTKTSGRLYVIT